MSVSDVATSTGWDHDWLHASSAQRALLHPILSEISAEQGTTVESLIGTALGQPHRYAKSIVDNARAGRLSRKVCAQLYSWMREKHPQRARDLDVLIAESRYELPTPESWNDFVLRNRFVDDEATEILLKIRKVAAKSRFARHLA